MTSGISREGWRDSLAGLSDPGLTAVLTVQCSLEWLKPGWADLRNEVDEQIAALALIGRGIRIDRIVLHNLPPLQSLSSAELRSLTSAQEDWMYRLAAVGDLFTTETRPRVHQFIVEGGDRRSVTLMDGMDLQVKGTWQQPDWAVGALSVVSSGTTPLTSYDVGRDGPFGDSDPSVYL